MSMGARIKVSRQSRDWSQGDLAAAISVSQTCVSNWEADNTYPRPDNLKALGKALGVTPRFLEEGEGGVALATTVDEVLASARLEIARVLNTKPSKIKVSVSIES